MIVNGGHLTSATGRSTSVQPSAQRRWIAICRGRPPTMRHLMSMIVADTRSGRIELQPTSGSRHRWESDGNANPVGDAPIPRAGRLRRSRRRRAADARPGMSDNHHSRSSVACCYRRRSLRSRGDASALRAFRSGRFRAVSYRGPKTFPNGGHWARPSAELLDPGTRSANVSVPPVRWSCRCRRRQLRPGQRRLRRTRVPTPPTGAGRWRRRCGIDPASPRPAAADRGLRRRARLARDGHCRAVGSPGADGHDC